MSTQQAQPSPMLFFNTIGAYQRTEAIKAAIELDLFTAIGEGAKEAREIAEKCQASERGVRILCDFLTIMGFLIKEGRRYGLTPDTAMFLDRRSPAYAGSAIDFLLSPMLEAGFKRMADAVRKGGTAVDESGTLAPEHPIWVQFARAMVPLTVMPAQLMAQLVDPSANRKLRVLDIAAGHGMYGLAFAQHNPQVEVTAVDWPNVLEVAKENAERAGVTDRYQTIPGSAFDVDYGTGYDIALLTNFLHHFDPQTNEQLLRRVHAALVEGGRAVTLEFVPNEDRVTPPEAAGFSLTMLCSTPAGDAYTFPQLEEMFRNAGFSRSEFHQLPPSIEQVVISHK